VHDPFGGVVEDVDVVVVVVVLVVVAVVVVVVFVVVVAVSVVVIVVAVAVTVPVAVDVEVAVIVADVVVAVIAVVVVVVVVVDVVVAVNVDVVVVVVVVEFAVAVGVEGDHPDTPLATMPDTPLAPKPDAPLEPRANNFLLPLLLCWASSHTPSHSSSLSTSTLCGLCSCHAMSTLLWYSANTISNSSLPTTPPLSSSLCAERHAAPIGTGAAAAAAAAAAAVAPLRSNATEAQWASSYSQMEAEMKAFRALVEKQKVAILGAQATTSTAEEKQAAWQALVERVRSHKNGTAPATRSPARSGLGNLADVAQKLAAASSAVSAAAARMQEAQKLKKAGEELHV